MDEKEVIINSNNTKIRTAVQGKGVPVILSHGGPGLYDYLKPVADMMEENAFVIRYDQRGCGRSEDRGPYNLDMYLEDMENIRKHFEIDKWIVAGHSWGANLSLVYCLKYPERVKALIYLSGTGIREDWRGKFEENFKGKLTEDEYERYSELKYRVNFSSSYKDNKLEKEYYHLFLKTSLYDPAGKIPEELEFPISQKSKRLWNDWESFIVKTDMAGELEKLNIPVLIIYGKGDPRPYRIAEEVAEILPDSKYVLLEKAGHFPWWEEGEKIRSELRDFIRTVKGKEI